MRAILMAALVATGVALAGVSPTLAAPANGTVIGDAANVNQSIDKVWWRHHYWHWRWHRHWRRWW